MKIRQVLSLLHLLYALLIKLSPSKYKTAFINSNLNLIKTMEASKESRDLYESPRDNPIAWDRQEAFERPITYQQLSEREKYLIGIAHTD